MPRFQKIEKTKAQRQAHILRTLAKWCDKHPHADVEFIYGESRIFKRLYVKSKEELAEKLIAIGSFRKEPDGDDFRFIVRVSPEIEIHFYTNRELVCERRIVGKKLVPEKIVPEEITPAHEEDIYEWDCGTSVLAPNGGEE